MTALATAMFGIPSLYTQHKEILCDSSVSVQSFHEHKFHEYEM